MASRSDNSIRKATKDFELEQIHLELKSIRKKLDQRVAPCLKCKARNNVIKQLKVEKVALLSYIKELEIAMKMQTEDDNDP